MSEKPQWYEQSLYEQAWENYRNEEENYRTILTQYLVFTAAFIYAATQSIGNDANKILGVIGAIVSLLAILYIGRVTRYSQRWMAIKDSAIGKDLAKNEHHPSYKNSTSKWIRRVFVIPGHVLLLAFPLAGFVLFLLLYFEVLLFTSS